ncbi:MAG: hypothetical protein ACTHWF_00620 [Brachybacterium sp.]|uniref:hypothetical protein n=1 Tax=Brachybacterium sp. Z12 TaxID=2759167 RepID=UPI0018612434|nr:hypothetical protein [Brachybacterium sp. Z12]QNN83086.1 hypothetical protein H3H54_05025 [Brachybacterium sp. Z12]
MRRPRRLVLSAAALGLALAASGCTYLSPVQTHDFYQAGDGTNANIEQDGALFAGVRNAVLVLGEDGTPVFTSTVVNYSDEEITVEIEGIAEDASIFSAQIQVPAQGTVQIGPGDDQQLVQVGAVNVVPGTVLDLDVSAGGETTTISLPTLETSLSHYELEELAEG